METEIRVTGYSANAALFYLRQALEGDLSDTNRTDLEQFVTALEEADRIVVEYL